MAHVQVAEGAFGIVGLMLNYPETEAPLNALAETLLRGSSSLSPAEREMIAAYVSQGNQCYFCSHVHAAVSREHYGSTRGIVDHVLHDAATAAVGDKMQSLLTIADKVRRDGRLVTDDDVARARAAGADDKAIHDTVLIAAAFCMFNRYVDGLGTLAAKDAAYYEMAGKQLAENGYLKSIRR